MSSEIENEYFCDGITEEIINALAKIEQLKVTSRTSSFHFKNKELPIIEIAETLGVSTLLEGSVRLSGDIIRITAQLIQAEEDFHFWSETWDRKLENIFEIQDEISLLIADKIRENFGHFEFQDHLVDNRTDDINAYEYSLMADFHKNKWSTDDMCVAEEFYKKSLALDPTYVNSIIGLADVYSFMGMTGTMPFQEAWMKCNSLIEKTLALDPNNPKAFYQKGHSAFFTECDFAKAFEYGHKAIKEKPNYVEAQQFMSYLYVLSGETEKAKKHLDIALGIDPLSQETLFFKAYFDYMTRNYPDALSQLEECLKVNPLNIPAHAVKPFCLIKMGRYNEVIDYYDGLEEVIPEGERVGSLALAYAHLNNLDKRDECLELIREHAKSTDGFTADSFLFMMYAVTGEIDKAFDWVENGIKNKSTLLMLRYPDPMVEVLREDQRYKNFFNQMYRVSETVTPKSDKKALLNDKEAEDYRNKLIDLVEQNEVFLDSGLTLRSLAEQIGIHPNKLSWLINEMHEKNFNQFINTYRIDHFKKLAADPNKAQFSILGLAYDSGFNSKTVFNTYFKKSTGQSPKAWMKAQ
jgi:TolB-like protein/AraC-like DNA-binding protein